MLRQLARSRADLAPGTTPRPTARPGEGWIARLGKVALAEGVEERLLAIARAATRAEAVAWAATQPWAERVATGPVYLGAHWRWTLVPPELTIDPCPA